VVNDTANATTSGPGSTVTAGSGTTGTYFGTAGTTYSLTEVAASGTLADYTPTISCTDANGVQAGLPTNLPFNVSLPITLAAGAAVSCVLTNQAVANAAPAITIVKSATVDDVNADGKTDLGDTVSWSYVVTNTGNITLHDVGVNDVTAGAVHCPDTSLAPGTRETCHARSSHTITQSDVDAGVVDNTATASGTATGSRTPTVSGPSSTTTPIDQSNGITLVKSATENDVNADGKTDLGDTIAWTYVVTNTGNVTLSNVGVNDPEAGVVHCLFTRLAPGSFETCAADTLHTISLADVDAGVVDNTATAQGSAPRSSVPTISASSSTSTPVVQVSGISLTKSALENSYSSLGQTIHYSFMVTNTGTVTLSHVGIHDDLRGLVGASCPITTMEPSASQHCTASYAVTQADMSAQTIVNQATAQGDPPGSLNPVVSQPSTVTTPLASIAIVKQVCASASAQDCRQGGAGPWGSSTTISPGSTVYWRIMVTNTGRIDLHGVTIADALEPSCGLAGGTLSVAVGASVGLYCATPSVTSSLINVATANFGGSGAAPVTSSAQINVAIPQSAASPGQLAFTGIESLDAKIGGGIAAIFVGLWFVVVSRRRRPRMTGLKGEQGGDKGGRLG
jgi:uncharacterized repeat protein (TIGR01451 family)